MWLQYNSAANNDDKGSSEGACVCGITDDDEDDVIRVLPANLML